MEERRRWWGDIHCFCVRPALSAACMASLWGLVSAQAAAPPIPSPCYLYSRDLVTTVWGFLLTLVALTVDDWGYYKNQDSSTFWTVAQVLLMGILNPFISLGERMIGLVYSMKLMKRLSGTPSAKPYIKTLSGCDVLVNMSADASAKLRHRDTLRMECIEQKVGVEDFSDAVVIGRPVQEMSLVQLNHAGKEALIRAEVLPPVEQLKIVQGYSEIAVAASAVQAVGYMYGVVVRLVQGLHVSPLEAIAFILNIVVLQKAMVHFYSSTCHRPLLVFLEAEEEAKFIMKCEAPGARWSLTTGEKRKFSVMIVAGTAILPGGLLMFFIVKTANATSFTIAIPLILIQGGIFLLVCFAPIFYFEDPYNLFTSISLKISFSIFVFVVPIVNIVGYVYGFVETVKYWEPMGFNIRSSSYLAQLFPYIG